MGKLDQLWGISVNVAAEGRQAQRVTTPLGLDSSCPDAALFSAYVFTCFFP